MHNRRNTSILRHDEYTYANMQTSTHMCSSCVLTDVATCTVPRSSLRNLGAAAEMRAGDGEPEAAAGTGLAQACQGAIPFLSGEAAPPAGAFNEAEPQVLHERFAARRG